MPLIWSYFSYPKTQENEKDFEGWKCVVCREEDPGIYGGSVAHIGDGRKHPIHRYCSWLLIQDDCPTCKMDTFSLLGKCMHVWRAILNPTPRIQMRIGSVCWVLGFVLKKYPLAAIGMALHARTIDRVIVQAIRDGTYQMSMERKINKLALEILSDANTCYIQARRLNRLNEMLTHMGRERIDIRESWPMIRSIRNIANLSQDRIIGDRAIRLWREIAMVGAIYCTLKSASSFRAASVQV